MFTACAKFHHKLKLGEFVEVTKRHWEDRQVGYIRYKYTQEVTENVSCEVEKQGCR